MKSKIFTIILLVLSLNSFASNSIRNWFTNEEISRFTDIIKNNRYVHPEQGFELKNAKIIDVKDSLSYNFARPFRILGDVFDSDINETISTNRYYNVLMRFDSVQDLKTNKSHKLFLQCISNLTQNGEGVTMFNCKYSLSGELDSSGNLIDDFNVRSAVLEKWFGRGEFRTREDFSLMLETSDAQID